MAKRTETINMTQEDMEEAISDWLHNHYGPPKPDLQFRPGVGPWKIYIKFIPQFEEQGHYEAEACRETK
jgi:hypothetical protein